MAANTLAMLEARSDPAATPEASIVARLHSDIAVLRKACPRNAKVRARNCKV